MQKTQDQSMQELLRLQLRQELGLRKARNPHYSLRAFARDLQISASHFSEYLRGRSAISRPQVQKIARIMGWQETRVEEDARGNLGAEELFLDAGIQLRAQSEADALEKRGHAMQNLMLLSLTQKQLEAFHKRFSDIICELNHCEEEAAPRAIYGISIQLFPAKIKISSKNTNAVNQEA